MSIKVFIEPLPLFWHNEDIGNLVMRMTSRIAPVSSIHSISHILYRRWLTTYIMITVVYEPKQLGIAS